MFSFYKFYCQNINEIKTQLTKDFLLENFSKLNKNHQSYNRCFLFMPFEKIKFILNEIVLHCPNILEQKDDKGKTILHYAATNSNIFGVKLIFETVDSLYPELYKVKDSDENTILHLLYKNNNMNVLNYIFEYVKKKNLSFILERNYLNMTILRTFVKHPELEFIKKVFDYFQKEHPKLFEISQDGLVILSLDNPKLENILYILKFLENNFPKAFSNLENHPRWIEHLKIQKTSYGN